MVMPALSTSTSMDPKVFTVWATVAPTASADVTSTANASAGRGCTAAIPSAVAPSGRDVSTLDNQVADRFDETGETIKSQRELKVA